MAENFYEYWQGSPEQRTADLEAQRADWEKNKGPYWAYMTPEQRMVVQQNNLYPTRTSDAASDAYNAGLYVMDMTSRPRDTLIRSAQELGRGNYGQAGGLALRALPSAVIPQLAAGTMDSPDDWRKYATPGTAMTLDVLTDPGTYMGIGMAGRMLKGASRADDATQAIRQLINAASNNPIKASAAMGGVAWGGYGAQ
jgi:hypothetical protein